jgi:hypothetical protein
MAGTTRRFSSWFRYAHPHAPDADADVVRLLLRRIDTCAPFARPPLVCLSGSGRLPVASTAPTQRPRFLLFTSSSPGPRLAQSRSPTHAGRPLPSFRHPVQGMCVHVFIRRRIILMRLSVELICAGASGSFGSRARVRVVSLHGRSEPRTMARPASRERERKSSTLRTGDSYTPRPHPVPPSASCGPAGFTIFPYMQIPVVSSSARRTVFLGADFEQYDAEFGVRSPSRLVPRRTHAPGSGSCGGAGAGVHRALPTFVHLAFIPTMYRLRLPARPSHAMLPPQLSPPSTNPARSWPRIMIPPSPFSSLPSLLCLCLSARVSVDARLTLVVHE